MLLRAELRKIARARLKDAELLFAARRFDGAVYMCGYAVELALKARICRTLNWNGFPATRREFESYGAFKTHVLLHLSGIESSITSNYFVDWSDVATWNPEVRYNPIGSATRPQAARMLAAAKRLIRVL